MPASPQRAAQRLYLDFRASSTADVTVSLLRSRDALLHLALMAAHLADGSALDGTTLADEIAADLAALGATDDTEHLTAEDILSRWTRRRWAHRSVTEDGRGERYQLTSGALAAVRQIAGARDRASTATESTLELVMDGLHRVARDADPDPEARRRAIDDEIARLRTERAALDAGEETAGNPGRATLDAADLARLTDRVRTLTMLAEAIPADIARYGEQMRSVTAELLRHGMADDAADYADALNRMFDGHDLIAESPEGRAFRAFATLMATPAARTRLDRDIEQTLAHVPDISEEQRRVLTGFIPTVWDRVREVEETRATAFRRMSGFVRSGDHLHHRSMRARIADAQAAAAAAFDATHGGRDIGFRVPTGGVDARSVGRLRLDPGTAAVAAPAADTAAEFVIDPATLVGTEAIDWPRLRDAVAAALTDVGAATLPDVLRHVTDPRTGDVVGIWALATRHGDVDGAPDGARTTVRVVTARGDRAISVPHLAFYAPIPDETARPRPKPRHLHDQPTLIGEDPEYADA